MIENFEECQAYVNHLRGEHHRLRECVYRIAQRLTEPATVFSKVIEDMEGLRAELTHHFEEEESGGCLDEAVSHKPRLSHEATGLLSEHPALLEQLEAVITRLRMLAGAGQPLDEIAADFHRFVDRLETHDSAENRILEEGFGIQVE